MNEVPLIASGGAILIYCKKLAVLQARPILTLGMPTAVTPIIACIVSYPSLQIKFQVELVQNLS